jgi:hypothetical protein
MLKLKEKKSKTHMNTHKDLKEGTDKIYLPRDHRIADGS